MTSLPLYWGEGDIAAQLGGRAPRATILDSLKPRPVDTLTARTLAGVDLLVLAQPRRLAPAELVALDDWVRRGGHLLVFADPALAWPPSFALGDARRGVPVTLLDPLFAHWGVTLTDNDNTARVRTLGGYRVASVSAGGWRRTNSDCRVRDALTIDCSVDRGRAVMIADADVLDDRRAEVRAADNERWVAARAGELTGQHGRNAPRLTVAAIAMAALVILAALGLTTNRRRT